ncbi:MAG: response regulator, partial [Alphaproteobacteria bacterium]|nr:response regulator [Alphaproteobacteria bacterium]
TISLPIAAEHTIKSDGHDLGGLNILFVHREDDMRELFPRYLERWGATVSAGGDIEGTRSLALDAIERGRPFDVICVGSGWSIGEQIETVERLQAEQALSSTRYVITCRDRDRTERKELDDTVYVDSGPLRRALFIRTVAVAVGRASPVVEQDEHEVSRRSGKAPTVEQAEAMGQLILLAEDNLTNQDVIGRQLTMLGYAFVIANDGREALELLGSRSFAILLTDCHMPNMDGFELAETIRTSEEGKDGRFPIIAITASVMKEEIDHCFAAGMDDYLPKPLEMAKLEEMLGKWLPASDLVVTGETSEATIADTTVTSEASGGDGSPIDPSALKDVFGDDEETFVEILREFVGPATSNAEEIEAAFGERSADGVANGAHKLKSSARSVGAHDLADLCQGLETAGKAANWDEIDRLAPRIPGTVQRVVEYINDL